MRVKFNRDFDYVPSGEPRVTLAYTTDGGPNGDGEYTVKRECGEEAVAAGAAEEVPAPPQEPAPKADARSR